MNFFARVTYKVFDNEYMYCNGCNGCMWKKTIPIAVTAAMCTDCGAYKLDSIPILL